MCPLIMRRVHNARRQRDHLDVWGLETLPRQRGREGTIMKGIRIFWSRLSSAWATGNWYRVCHTSTYEPLLDHQFVHMNQKSNTQLIPAAAQLKLKAIQLDFSASSASDSETLPVNYDANAFFVRLWFLKLKRKNIYVIHHNQWELLILKLEFSKSF